MKKHDWFSIIVTVWIPLAGLGLSGCGPQESGADGKAQSGDKARSETVTGPEVPPPGDDRVNKHVAGANAQNQIAEDELNRLQRKFGIEETQRSERGSKEVVSESGAGEKPKSLPAENPDQAMAELLRQLNLAREERNRAMEMLDALTRERVDLDGELNRLKQRLEEKGR